MMSLDPMLLARSVAVVGASERQGSVGDQMLRQLVSGGFDGPIYPVNPRYETLHGLRCYPDLESVGEPVDLVVLAVANAHLEAGLVDAAKIGAGAAAIFASCHGETPDGTPLRARLFEIAADAGIPICGGNGMGFLNVEAGLRVCGFYQPPDLTARRGDVPESLRVTLLGASPQSSRDPVQPGGVDRSRDQHPDGPLSRLGARS